MNAHNSIVWIGGAALLLGGFVGGLQAASGAHHRDSDQVSNLLLETKTMAFQLRDDAATMQGYKRIEKWESHMIAVERFKEHIYAFSDQAKKLKAAASAAAPWQKAVIDQVAPYMNAMAADTEGVIDELEVHPSLLGTPECDAYLAANVAYASDMAGLIANLVDYGKLREMMRQYDGPEESCRLNGGTYRSQRRAQGKEC